MGMVVGEKVSHRPAVTRLQFSNRELAESVLAGCMKFLLEYYWNTAHSRATH